MLLDLQNLMSDGQTLIAAVGTVVSTNIIDLGVTGTIPGGLVGTPLDDTGRDFWFDVWAQITTTYLAAAGASTVTAQFCQSANADLSAPDVLNQSDAIAKATLVAGYQFRVGGGYISKRYVGMQYVIATNNGTAGAVSAAVGPRGFKQTNPQV